MAVLVAQRARTAMVQMEVTRLLLEMVHWVVAVVVVPLTEVP
jgi:hypothetical protein